MPSRTASNGTAVVTTPTDTQILITREFEAPRHLVYRVYTEPEFIRRWWAGDKGEVTLVEVDLRVGGSWRYVMVANGGFEVGFHGEFREIVPDEGIVNTEIYEGVPGDESSLVTVTFTEHDGRTTLRQLAEYGTTEVRDMVIQSGMEGGVQSGWDLIEQIAIDLADRDVRAG